MASRRADEDGAATVLVLTVAGLVLSVGFAVVAVTGAFAAARRAQSGADLAALAGAAALRDGGDGCAVASQVAAANGTRLDACRVEGQDLVVRVSVPLPTATSRRLVGRARAGPSGP